MSWQQSTIDEACLLVTDGTHYTPPDVGQGIPFITVKDCSNDGHIDLVGCSHITGDEFAKAEKGNSAPKRGDILFSKDGTVGKVYVVDTRETFAVLSSLAILRPDASRLDASYFGWVLKTDSCLDQASQSKTGSAIRRIILKDLRKVRFPLPPLDEQKRIAGILDAADALRAKRREALAQLNILLQSTFLDMFGDPVTNPMGLPRETLKSACKFTTGKLDSNAAIEGGKYPFFTCARETSTIDDYAFDCEALLLAGNNANADYSVKHYKGRFNAYQRTYVITINESALTYAYARLVLEYLLGDLKRFSKGTNTKYLTMVILNRMPILVPPLDLQHRFAAIVESVEQQKTSQRAHLAELDTLFASLQSRAFRGDL